MPDEINPDHGTGFLLVANWTKWQTFRKDRGTPDWIKLHRRLLTSGSWGCLSDLEKGQLVSMWLVASDRDGRIPNDDRIVRKLAQLDDYPNLSRFIELGFLVPDRSPSGDQVVTIWLPDGDQVVTNRLPIGSPRVEKSREEKSIVSTEDSTYSRKSEADLRGCVSLQSWFDHEFWPSYPKKRNKGQARRAMQALKPDVELRKVIMSGLARAMTCEDWRRDGGQYIPYAATWIRAHGWEDEYEIQGVATQPRKLTALEQSEEAIRQAIEMTAGKTYEH